MKKIECDECGICPIKDECNQLEFLVNENCSLRNGGYEELIEIYTKGKIDGQVETIDEVIKIAKSISVVKSEWKESFSNERVYKETIDFDVLMEKLKELKENNYV